MAALSATVFALHEWVVDKGADRVMYRRRTGKLGYPGRVLDAAAEDLVELRRVEFAGLADGEWDAAQDAVAESLRAARLDRLARADPAVLIDPDRLRDAVRIAGDPAVAGAALSEGGLAAYRRLLEQTCRRVAVRAREIDAVMRALHVGTASTVEKVLDRVERIAGQPELRERHAQDSFERRYVSYVAAEHATFELFQVHAGRAPVRHAFADFYSAPSIARRTGRTRSRPAHTRGDRRRSARDDRLTQRGGHGGEQQTAEGPDADLPRIGAGATLRTGGAGCLRRRFAPCS